MKPGSEVKGWAESTRKNHVGENKAVKPLNTLVVITVPSSKPMVYGPSWAWASMEMGLDENRIDSLGSSSARLTSNALRCTVMGPPLLQI